MGISEIGLRIELFRIDIRELEWGEGDSKFQKMVELLGLQNRKVVELLGVTFAQKDLFFKISELEP